MPSHLIMLCRNHQDLNLSRLYNTETQVFEFGEPPENKMKRVESTDLILLSLQSKSDNGISEAETAWGKLFFIR